MKTRTDITSKRYGKLTVLEYSHTITECKVNRPCWLCLCDCGNTTTVCGHRLKSGNTMSCGCQYNKTSNREASIISLIYRYPEGQTRGEMHKLLDIPLMSLDRILKRMVRDDKLVKVGVRKPKYGKRCRPVSYIYLLSEWDGTRREGYQRCVKPKPCTLVPRVKINIPMELRIIPFVPSSVSCGSSIADRIKIMSPEELARL